MTLSEFEKAIRERFKYCADFRMRKFTQNGGAKVIVCAFRDLTGRECISERIIRPLLNADGKKRLCDTVQSAQVCEFDGNIDSAVKMLLSGNAAAARGMPFGDAEIIFCAADEDGGRGTEEPTSDVTVRGPKAGFCESCEKNISAIRRIIRSEKLHFEEFIISKNTGTRAVLAYVDGIADEKTVKILRKKLKSVDIYAPSDSASLEIKLCGGRLFPSFGSSEKADKTASKLMSGRVAIITDGSPFVLTAPYVAAEALQSPEDYLTSSVYASAMRVLRFVALMISVLLPGVFYACASMENGILPESVSKIIYASREKTPLGLFWEIFLMLFVFEILREVGVRMPRTVGDAASIVGSVIIGDAATRAGIASTVVLIVVAVSAVCTFIVPVYMNAQIIFRFAFLFAAGIYSFFGIVCVGVLLLCYLAGKESFGVAYLSPLSPPDFRGLFDFLLVIPEKVTKRRDRIRAEKEGKKG